MSSTATNAAPPPSPDGAPGQDPDMPSAPQGGDTAAESPPSGEPSEADPTGEPDNAKDARYRQRLRDAEAELEGLRPVAEERDRLAERVREYERRDIATEHDVPVDKVKGDTPEEMRASAEEHRADIDAAVQAEMARRGVNPAAPAGLVTSDGRAPAGGPSFVDAFKPKRTSE